MQWLTAILAFATTMLIFSIVVTALVETIHRTFGSRQRGLKSMLDHFYDEVLAPYLKKTGVKLDKAKFLTDMTAVRAPMSGQKPSTQNLWPQSFKLLKSLPKETFMERLGTSDFSQVATGKSESDTTADEPKSNAPPVVPVQNPKQMLKDIAQKYEAFGRESGEHFASRARLCSMIVAMFVAWIFYVHPYELICTYMQNPEIAGKVAAMADSETDRYDELLKELEKLGEETSVSENGQSLTKAEVQQLLEEINEELKKARTDVDELSKAGAPVGWPATGSKYFEVFPQFELFKTTTKPVPDSATSEDDNNATTNTASDQSSQQAATDDNPKDDEETKSPDETKPEPDTDRFQIGFWYPTHIKNVFWLIIGGLLIGLGAPFWAQVIRQMKEGEGFANSLAGILKPETRKQPASKSDLEAMSVGSSDEETPLTSAAFYAAAEAKE